MDKMKLEQRGGKKWKTAVCRMIWKKAQGEENEK